MVWHPDQAEFLKAHGFDSSVVAFSLKTDNSVHLGPAVTSENFDTLFGHELVHIILYQKYKGAVPKWLEEGLANYLSNNRRGSLWKVDYSWLATQPPRDVLTLGHPFKGAVQGNARFHYQASHALMEMIASHCTVTDLLQLSVSKKLESYLPTLCEISDVNAEFRKWVARKAKAAGP
jgi:phage terminase large subunit-like protein